MKEDQDRKHLNRLDIHMSMGPDSVHTQVPSEMIDVILRPPLTIFQSGDTPEDWKKADVIPAFKKGKMDLGNYRPVSLILIPRNPME